MRGNLLCEPSAGQTKAVSQPAIEKQVEAGAWPKVKVNAKAKAKALLLLQLDSCLYAL